MKSTLQISKMIFLNRSEVKFFLLLIVFFVLGQVLHYLSHPYTTPFLVHKLTAAVSSKIINVLTPGENTNSHNAVIGSGNYAIDISEGCEGIEGIILLTAAILAFYAGIKEKIFGILLGMLILYLSNLLRIIVLYYTFKYKPEFFDVMHIFAGQTFIIFIGILFFILWINTCAGIDDKTG